VEVYLAASTLLVLRPVASQAEEELLEELGLT